MRFRAAIPVVFFALLPAGARGAEAHDDAAQEALARAATNADPDASAEALFRLAEVDDAEGRFARALERYDGVATRSPSSRYVPRAAARASILRSHAEGDFAPFARLEALRADPKRADDPREIDALARDADGFPPGLVRVEARMLAAEAYLGRLGRPADGIAALRKIVTDPRADPLTARHAARLLVDALVAADDLSSAVSATQSLGPAVFDAALEKHLKSLVRRRAAHRGALAVLAALLLLFGASVVSAARRGALLPVMTAVVRSLPVVLAFAAYVALFGGALAAAYESGNAAPFLLLGAVLVPLVLLSRAWAAAAADPPAPLARAARAVMCASAVVAGGFLVLEALDTAYLAGFGL